MNEKLLKKKNTLLIFLCWLVYLSSYFGRLDLSASLIRITHDLSLTNAEGGSIISFFFFAYGIGQLFNGLFGERYPLRLAIFLAMMVSSAMNICVTLTSSTVMLRLIWMLNGLAQSVLWSALIRTLGRFIVQTRLNKATLVMGTTVAGGTALAYAVSALNISFFHWHITFISAAVCMTLAGLLWFFAFPFATAGTEQEKRGAADTRKKTGLSPVLWVTIIFMMAYAILNNLIKDGITTWTPSILNSLYHIPDNFSILLTLGLPIIAMFGCFLSVFVNRWIRDYVVLCGVFFLSTFVSVGLLVLMIPSGMWPITFICFAISAFSMSAANNVITCLMPLQMRDAMDCGKLAGVTDSFCYVGSTISTYSLGALADHSGWNAVFYFLLLLCGAAILTIGLYKLIQTRLVKN